MRKIRRSAVLKRTDERGNRLLGIAVDHDGVVICKERILDTGETAPFPRFSTNTVRACGNAAQSEE